MGMKNSFPKFGNGIGKPVFPGMVGNGNSRSPLSSHQLLGEGQRFKLGFKLGWEELLPTRKEAHFSKEEQCCSSIEAKYRTVLRMKSISAAFKFGQNASF